MSKEATARSAMKLALEALADAHHRVEHKQDAAGREKAMSALRKALADFWEGYVPEPVKPAQPVPDAFEQLMREADKPTQVLQDGVAEYVDALVKGTHEITSVTIRPKRTWQGLTQEEFRDFATTHEYGTGGLIRAIEAKLRSKNEDRN